MQLATIAPQTSRGLLAVGPDMVTSSKRTIGFLCSPCADRIETTASNSSSIVASIPVDVGTLSGSHRKRRIKCFCRTVR
jgi:hypothetical protein